MIKKPLRQLSAEAARLRMADLCSRSEQCEADIVDKLARHGISRSESEKIVAFLYEHGFLDEARFTKAFVRDKLRFNGWGQRKIRYSLALKRIPSALVNQVIEETGGEAFFDAALKAARTKARSLDTGSYEDCVKIFRYLAGRGFDPATASKAVSAVKKESRDGDKV